MNFRINITGSCNLRCTYCLEQHFNYISSDILPHLDAVFDFIKKVRPKFECDNDSISVWGGEPLVKMETMLRLLELADDYIKDYEFPPITIFTNGIIDPTPLAKYKHLFKLIISYDGMQNTLKNRLRGDEKKLKKLFDNMQKCYDNQIMFGLKITMTEECFDQMFRSYAEIFYIAQKFAPYCITGNEIKMEIDFRGNKPYREEHAIELRKQLDLICSHIKKYNSKLNIFKNWDDRKKCVTGYGSYFFHVDGSVYPCYQCVYVNDSENYKLGTVYDNDLSYVFKNYDKFIQTAKTFNAGCDGCSKCSANSCSRCFLILKDFDDWSDMGTCEYYRIIAEYGRKLSNNITSHN